jgi:hypothetical protein
MRAATHSAAGGRLAIHVLLEALMNVRSLAPAFVAAGLGVAAPATAQNMLIVPIQAHNSLTFELHSVKDDVQLYQGDSQNLLKLELRPYHNFPPQVEFTNPRLEGTLRVIDLSLLEKPPEPADSTDDEFADDESPQRPPDHQQWVLQLAPAAPTDFVMQCDGGKGNFDFTDLPVRTVHLLADSAAVEVKFDRPNGQVVERFKLTVRAGSLVFRDILNARLKLATLQVDDSRCELEFTGKPDPGLSEVFVEGTPKSLEVSLSRRIGVHVEGTVATVLLFDREGMVRQGLGLETAGFETQPAQLRLHFSRTIPKLEVRWVD